MQIALIVDTTVTAADFELERRIRPPGSQLQPALALAHNRPEAVNAEPAIRKALAQAAGFKDLEKIQDIQLSVSADHWGESSNVIWALSYYKLRYPSLEARNLFPPRLQTEIEKYLRTRLLGHTREFALASLARNRSAPVGTERAKAGLLNVYKEIPESWLKPWEEGGKQIGYYLVDGELAWTFGLMNPTPWRQIVDAQEFDPKLKEAFAAARKKAEENLAARGVVRRMGYVHYFWAELKKVLREDHKIHWRCPTDLNAGIYD